MKPIAQYVQDIVKAEFAIDTSITLARPEPQFGDYATNIALQLAKQVGKNPRVIAAAIAEKLGDYEAIRQVEVAGPGFINIFLADDLLVDSLGRKYDTNREGETVVIETNNPNPFKAMHIGHAFNAILADTIANLIEADGASVYRVSYHGDVGLHVGKSMYSLLRYVDGNIEKLHDIPESDRNSFMSHMYAEGSRVYKESEDARQEIDDLAKQSFVPKTKLYQEVYELCKEWSFEDIDRLVARLGNKPIERRFLESDADHRGVKIVKDYTPKVFQESDGAYVFKGSEYGSFDNVFVSSNGRGLYAARDLGLMQLKNEYYHPKKSYIVTAEEQKAYFKGVIAAAELCFPEYKKVTVNISTGTVKLTTGKMSSRDGDVVEIAWLFEQVADAIRERGGEVNEAVVAGSLRYQFLKVRVGSDVVFDVNEAVSITGNSGPYLQYAHARARSILSKSQKVPLQPQSFEEDERTFVVKLGEYGDQYNRSVSELAPHHLCNYLYELSQTFNRFYEKNRVIDDSREAERLWLVKRYADTLKSGLGVLGIVAPEKM